MQQFLSQLPEVKAGDKMEDVLTASYLNAINGALLALTNGENIQSGANTRKKGGAGWVVISSDQPLQETIGEEHGCPFDLWREIVNDSDDEDDGDEDSSGDTAPHSSWSAVKYSVCNPLSPEEGVSILGVPVLSRMSEIKSTEDDAGWRSYFSIVAGGGEETWLGFNMSALCEIDGATIYGYSRPLDVGNFQLSAEANVDALTGDSFLRLWGLATNTYATLATQNGAVDLDSKSFMWGYAMFELFNYSAEASGTEAFYRLFDNIGLSYLNASIDALECVVHGYASTEVYNYKLGASITDDSSFLRVWGDQSNVYATIATEELKSFVWGYSTAAITRYDYSLESNVADQIARLKLWDISASVYTQVAAEVGKSYVWGAAEDEKYNYRLGAEQSEDSSYLRVWGENANVYASVFTGVNLSSVYGYSNDNLWNYKIQATADTGKFELYSTSLDGYAQMYAIPGNAGFSCSNTDEIASTLEPSSLVLVENDNETTLWAEGLTITDGTSTISALISEITGLTASFKEIERCDGMKAKVLMTEWY